jgi:hypothetical protein
MAELPETRRQCAWMSQFLTMGALVLETRQTVPNDEALIAPMSANKSLGARGTDFVVCNDRRRCKVAVNKT